MAPVKVYDCLIWIVTFIFIFLALVNGTQASNIPDRPAGFVPMNIETSKLLGNKNDVECGDGKPCSKQKTKMAVSTLREGVQTDRRPQIVELYVCSKQKMEGIMQSQNYKFCDTKEAQLNSFKAQVFEFYRDRKLVKAHHCDMVTLDYLCYSNVVGGISSHKVLHRHRVSQERCLETLRLNEFDDNPMRPN